MKRASVLCFLCALFLKFFDVSVALGIPPRKVSPAAAVEDAAPVPKAPSPSFSSLDDAPVLVRVSAPVDAVADEEGSMSEGEGDEEGDESRVTARLTPVSAKAQGTLQGGKQDDKTAEELSRQPTPDGKIRSDKEKEEVKPSDAAVPTVRTAPLFKVSDDYLGSPGAAGAYAEDFVVLGDENDENKRAFWFSKRPHSLIEKGKDGSVKLTDEDKDPKDRYPVFVVSLDGGGVRGIITLEILSHLEGLIGCSIPGFADLLVGTSAGGIEALGLASKESFSAGQMVAMYERFAKSVFQKTPEKISYAASIWNAVTSPVTTFWNGASYDVSSVETGLGEVLGDDTLGDCKLPVCVVTVDEKGDKKGPRMELLSSYSPSTSHVAVKQAGCATAGAPGYFRHTKLDIGGRSCQLVDGGVVANTPEQIALFESDVLFGRRPLILLSVGTGEVEEERPGNNGLTYVNELIEGAETALAVQHPNWSSVLKMRQEIAPVQYKRLQVVIPRQLAPMDKVANMDALKRVAREWCASETGKKQLGDVAKLLKSSLAERKRLLGELA